VSIVTARLVGREAFGALGIVQSTAGMIGTFAGLGLGMAATRYLAILRSVDPPRAGRIVTLTLAMALVSGCAAGVALFVLAPWLAVHTIRAAQLAPQLRIASLLLAASTVSTAQIGVLMGLEAFQTIAGIGVLRGALTLVIGVTAAWRWRLIGAVWALAISAALGCSLNQFALSRQCRRATVPPRLHNAWQEWPILWHFSFPAWLSGIMVAPSIWAACAMLVSAPSGYRHMGVFNAANQWRNAALLLPTVLCQPLLPIFADLHARRANDLKEAMWSSLKTVGLVSAVAAGVICVGSPLIMAAYGTEFRRSWPVLCMLAVSTVPAACCSVVGQAIAACGKLWPAFGMNLLWAAALIGFSLPSRQFGAAGLSGAFLISYALHAIAVTSYALCNRGMSFSHPVHFS